MNPEVTHDVSVPASARDSQAVATLQKLMRDLPSMSDPGVRTILELLSKLATQMTPDALQSLAVAVRALASLPDIDIKCSNSPDTSNDERS